MLAYITKNEPKVASASAHRPVAIGGAGASAGRRLKAVLAALLLALVSVAASCVPNEDGDTAATQPLVLQPPEEVLPEGDCKEVAHLSSSNRSGCFLYPQGGGKEHGRGLRVMRIENMEGLGSLPSWISRQTDVEILNVTGNENLTSIPDWIGSMSNLIKLDVSGNPNLIALPDSIGDMTGLRSLEISGNRNLSAIPNTIANLGDIPQVIIENNPKAADIPPEVHNAICGPGECTMPSGNNSFVKGRGADIVAEVKG